MWWLQIHGKFSWIEAPNNCQQRSWRRPKNYESSFMEFYSWPTVRLPPSVTPYLQHVFFWGGKMFPNKQMLRLGDCCPFEHVHPTCKKPIPGASLNPTHSWFLSQHPIRWKDILELSGPLVGEMFHGLLLLASRKPKGEILSKLYTHILPVFWILIG